VGFQMSMKEEIANAITHGIGFLLSIPALVILIIFAAQTNDPWKIVSFTIFGVSMILLFLSSTLLHSFSWSKAGHFFAILDHSAIYLLIAGTYTPFVLIPLRGALGWTLFGIVWGIAIAGVIFKFYFVNRFNLLSTILYVVMGWLIVIGIKPLFDFLGKGGFILLLTGGLLYTVGAIFYTFQKVPFFHAVWHLFVLAGSTAMYFCILFYI
jgi:hemolysin III